MNTLQIKSVQNKDFGPEVQAYHDCNQDFRSFQGGGGVPQTTCPALNPEAQAHWKLYPPSHPVTSTTSPMKYSPGTLRLCIVLASSSAVSTPPAVTSALAYPSVPAGVTRHA